MASSTPAIVTRTANPAQESWCAAVVSVREACAIINPILVAKVMPVIPPSAKANAANRGFFLFPAMISPRTSVSGLKKMASARVATAARCELTGWAGPYSGTAPCR